jgi:hypothetical protein
MPAPAIVLLMKDAVEMALVAFFSYLYSASGPKTTNTKLEKW